MITEIFSKEQRRLRGKFPDTYQYDEIPLPLRRQVIYIFQDFFSLIKRSNLYYDLEAGGHEISPDLNDAYNDVYSILIREYGIPDERNEEDNFMRTGNRFSVPSSQAVKELLSDAEDAERVLDIIQLLFQHTQKVVIRPDEYDDGYEIIHLPSDVIKKFEALVENSAKEAYDEINIRFQEHGVGYQFEPGSSKFIRVDSQYTHSRVVRPALNLLSDPMYKPANEEFLKAHKHYRKGEYKSCISECSNTFESVLKIICENNGWAFGKKKPTSKQLLDKVYEKGLLPTHTESFFRCVRGGLEHGIPTTRNEIAAHGQGSREVTVPIYVAEYVLNLTASAILLLIKANPCKSEREKNLILMQEEDDLDEQMLAELKDRLDRENY